MVKGVLLIKFQAKSKIFVVANKNTIPMTAATLASAFCFFHKTKPIISKTPNNTPIEPSLLNILNIASPNYKPAVGIPLDLVMNSLLLLYTQYNVLQ